jgi:hypothetical protein
MPQRNPLFDLLKRPEHRYRPQEIAALFTQVDQQRIQSLSTALAAYINDNLPAAIDRRSDLSAYRTNPYVLMTSASVMRLEDPTRFAEFLFNTKLYMGLETSFGKSVEAAFVGPYPLRAHAANKWADPPEKITEATALLGLSREQKARARTESVWREIDKSCVIGHRRYLTSIKSGPNCINDTQVQAMTMAITSNKDRWLQQTMTTYPAVRELDVVVGLTYGTDRTTNNKENQILVKLLEHGFREEDRARKPGVLIDAATSTVRVYRRVGKDFWSFIGSPDDPPSAAHVFLEILLALSKSLSEGVARAELETRINQRIQALSTAIAMLTIPRQSLPNWIRQDFSESELFWFATAMTAFYDQGV